MNTIHYSNLFNSLDTFMIKEDITKTSKPLKVKEYVCCSSMEIVKNETFETCINCGVQQLKTFELERPNVYLNQRFHNSTLIGGYSSKFFMVKRLQRNSNYDYKEITLLKSLKVLDEISKQFDFSNVVLVQAKSLYKDLYIDKKISSRDNIKRAVYIYCIYSACIHNKENVELLELLEDQDVTIKHFETAIHKIEPDLIFMNRKLIKYYGICQKNKLDITKDTLLKSYGDNYYMKQYININSIIIGTIYDLVKDNVNSKKFITMFKTTKITLKKFKNLKKNDTLKPYKK